MIVDLIEKKDSITLAKEVYKLKRPASLIEAPQLTQAVVNFNDGLSIGHRGDILALLVALIDSVETFLKKDRPES